MTVSDERAVLPEGDGPRVVIIGAGFAGISAAKELVGAPVSVTIVDAENFHTFQPLLYQVATAGLDVGDVVFPVRSIFWRGRNIAFRHARVHEVDLEAREVSLVDGSSLSYDYLIVGTGATAAFFGIAGADKYTHPLYTLRDARHLRNEVLGTLEEVDAHPERHPNGGPVIAIVGGGPTGVEMAGALAELLKVAVDHDHFRFPSGGPRIVVVDVAERLLAGFRDRSSRYAKRTVERRGIEVRLDHSVTRVEDKRLTFADGSTLDADLVIWAAGVTVTGTLAATIEAPSGKGGRVIVEDDLSLPGHREVFAVGDAALVPSSPGGPPCPQLAQVAIQSGRFAAIQVLGDQSGRSRGSFRYHDKGIMATIGRRSAVAELAGPGPVSHVVLKGTLGWLAWLGLHLVYLIGFRNRLLVLLNWFWRYLGWPSGPRVIVSDDSGD